MVKKRFIPVIGIFLVICSYIQETKTGAGKSFGFFAGGALAGGLVTKLVKDKHCRERHQPQEPRYIYVQQPAPVVVQQPPQPTYQQTNQADLQALKQEIQALRQEVATTNAELAKERQQRVAAEEKCKEVAGPKSSREHPPNGTTKKTAKKRASKGPTTSQKCD